MVKSHILPDLINLVYDNALNNNKPEEEAYNLPQEYKQIPSVTIGLGIQLYDDFEDNNCAFYAAEITYAIVDALNNYNEEDNLKLQSFLPQFFDRLDDYSFTRKSTEYLIDWATNKRKELLNKKL